MRKLFYSIMISLDGYIEGPGHDLRWPVIDEELHQFVNEQDRQKGMYLFGRRMYETLAAYWPTADSDLSNPDFIIDYAKIWKSKPKVVFSNSLQEVGENTRLVRGNLEEEIRALKEQPGGDLVIGGAEIAGAAMRLGLVDAYQVYIHPIILGGGAPMFPLLEQSQVLGLVESRIFKSGVVYHCYER